MGLRPKIIISVIFTFLLSLGGVASYTYFEFSKKEFQKNQELLLTRAQSLSEQMRQKATLADKLVGLLYKQWTLSPSEAQAIINEQSEILFFAVVRFNSAGESVYLDKLSNKSLQYSPLYDFNRLNTIPARILINKREIQDKEVLTIPSGFLTGSPSMLHVRRQPNNHYAAFIFDISTMAAQLSKDQFFDNVILHQNGKAFIGHKVLKKDNVSKILSTTLPMNSIEIKTKDDLILQSYMKDDKSGIIGVASVKASELKEPFKKVFQKAMALGVMGLCLAGIVVILVTGSWNRTYQKLMIALEDIANGKGNKIDVTNVKGELSQLHSLIIKLSSFLNEAVNKRLEKELKNQSSSQTSQKKKELVQLLRPSSPIKNEKLEVASSLNISQQYNGSFCEHVQKDNLTTIFMFQYSGPDEEAILALGSFKTAIELFKNLPNQNIDKCVGLFNQSLSMDTIDSSKLSLMIGVIDHNAEKVSVLNCGLPSPFIGQLESIQNLRTLQDSGEQNFDPKRKEPYKIQNIALKPQQLIIFPLFSKSSADSQKLFLQAFLKSFQNFQSLPMSSSLMAKIIQDRSLKENAAEDFGHSIILVNSAG